MTRWTEADAQAYQARRVSLAGKVNPVQVATLVVARKAAKAPRYTARGALFDGIRFDSQAELRRYKDLKLMEAAQEIEGLKVHPRFDLYACGTRLGFIELDFAYLALPARVMIHEDVKDPKKNSSTRTPIYKWKRRHLKAEHNIDVTEVS